MQHQQQQLLLMMMVDEVPKKNKFFLLVKLNREINDYVLSFVIHHPNQHYQEVSIDNQLKLFH
jgi:hypothetical protein